ncbi:hypothetical protein BOW53_06890 [Solemya pervernicosa gill symbiont]|uniref:Two-component system response regulator n=2 Tax=Gammaproteobacteria incertae sedis TaxID=118884 RepID=A0A1T2L6B4_9GAMM|nr:EAL domain-containing protein [Candidatus Reidiella endopervernicosa]OOZ40648.1 hypothetical protein BOW53_06890 [Solemya pervernicosa gill symbiont]QKQ27404.1 EAL domain-containing protein [Candidatus Reidiella endopervernicosa]
MDGEKRLHLLIGESSFNVADDYVSAIRDAGFAVREKRVEDLEDLEEALNTQRPDLILCSTGMDELSPREIITALSAHNIELPLIMVDPDPTPAARVEAMRAGATDLIIKGDIAHLQLVVSREYRNLINYREMVSCKSAFGESERRCHGLLDNSRDAIAYIHEGMHIYANSAYLERFGYDDSEELEGMPVMDMVDTEDQAKFKDYLRAHAKGKSKESELDLQLVTLDGKGFQGKLEFSPATIDGEPCTQIIIRDHRASKDLEEKLQYLSKQDLLTGLYNRQYFLDELEVAVEKARSGTAETALIYIDLDNFKEIKEQVGIAGSDLVLTDVAKMLSSKVAENDTLARFGDSTFTVLSYNKQALGAEMLAEELRHAVTDVISEVGVQSITTTCSIGISTIDSRSVDAHEVISQADLACEVAKKGEGNKTHIHDPVADQEAGDQRDEDWVERIKLALKENRFRLVFQPIVSLHGDSRENYEVLVRMIDTHGDVIMPGQFIQAAEQANLLAIIDRWVIVHAISVIADQRRSGRNTHFFIKMSGASVVDEGTLGWIRECLQKHRLEGDAITFEVHEEDATHHLKTAKVLFEGLKQLHCSVALEHFGKGAKSFNILKHLPVDMLKIDGSFIHHLGGNRENQAMVKSITDMAKSLEKKTIAEFVEDANSLSVLWTCGVNYIQGYFLQGPEEVLEFDFVNEGV